MKNNPVSEEAKRVEDFYNTIATTQDFKIRTNHYYHKQIEHLFKFIIPPQQKVIEIGCGVGDLLASVRPSIGVGIDIAESMVKIAKKKHPHLVFKKSDGEHLEIKNQFDYIILSDLIGILEDIQNVLNTVHKISHEDSRIIITYNNYFWEPFLVLAAKLGLKTPQPAQSWLSEKDIENLLELANLETIKKGDFLLIPLDIPFISTFTNKYIARLPLIRNLCFVKYIIARQKPSSVTKNEYSVSIILPARNESGNIEKGVKEIPNLGKKTQIIFVEDHSTDDTRNEIKRVINKYKNKKEILYFIQTDEYGKAAAVRKGFKKASGDIVIVFDSDLSTDPKELPKFYQALQSNKAEFVQGSRLIYPIEKDAMRILNILGNKIFSIVFSFLLDQRIKDTLCGTKALFRKDYEKILKRRSYFGDFDPFGDFDLIFGSSKLNLKIMEIPIRYKAREYGRSNISRFKHGWLLLKMTIIAATKIKFF